jgi:hypothetical protein
MKTALRIAAALAVVALAAPAFACSEQKTTAASAEKGDATKKQQVASNQKAPAQAAVKTSSATR